MRPIKQIKKLKRINVNVSDDVHRRLKQKVAKEGTTMSQVLEGLVIDYLDGSIRKAKEENRNAAKRP